MKRLTMDSLSSLSDAVQCFRYDRSGVKTGIVHLGVGAFHRAHQGIFIEDCLERGETAWGITAASLRNPDMANALNPQDGLYTLAVRSSAGDALRVVGAIQNVLVASENPARLIARMAHPQTRLVSLTVTEKGYCHDPASGALNEDHPDIRHDLATPHQPRSAIGYLVAALAERRKAGLKPFTIVSCDNLPSNGRIVKKLVQRYATLVEADLGRWVEDEVLCPSSMVDRIVPATTDEDKARIAGRLGLADHWPVMTEPFSQWVLEDTFSAGRPDLAAAGVQLVQDVTPFERMKLRLLNGAHSTIAYLGYLGGHETVADAMAVPAFARFIRAMLDDEISPTLRLPAGTDIEAYKEALMQRFANTALRHRTWQIAMDGSQKLPQRLLDTMRERLVIGAPIGRMVLAVAGWMRYVTGRDEQGKSIDIRDAMAERFREIATAAGPDAKRLAPTLLAIHEIFGHDLPNNPGFTGPVTIALERLFKHGAMAEIRALASA